MKAVARHNSPTIVQRPFSLAPSQCEDYFGFKARAMYDLISSGKLHRGYHYLKIGKKVVIVCEKFIEWLEEQDQYGSPN